MLPLLLTLSVLLKSESDGGWVDDFSTFTVVSLGLFAGLVSLAMALWFAWQVSSIELPNDKPETVSISKQIQEGAEAFLKKEYQALSVFVVVVGILLAAIGLWETAVNMLVGAILSAVSGYLGMAIAVRANVRTTLASQGPEGLNNGLRVAFKSGAVMALMVVGTGLVGLSVMFLIFAEVDEDHVWEHLSGFAFGGSAIALFARVGGGIYTKAADVGADLVGKVEEELSEDSPDNPATIADNVGDNVGDVAGMGADLFESFVGSIVAAAALGQDEFPATAQFANWRAQAFPFWLAGFGAIASIIGTYMVRTGERVKLSDKEAEKLAKEGKSQKEIASIESGRTLEHLLHTIRKAIWFSSFLVVAFTALCVCIIFGPEEEFAWQVFLCVIFGLICGNLIGYFTEYATSYTYWPTQSIAEKSDTGPATVMIQGLGVGMISTVPPVIFIFATILGSYYMTKPHGVYGVAVSAVGMLSTLGVTLATDAFGPVADNAGGIAEMAPDAEISEEVRETTDSLDALGNTTAATGKGFAIGSAVLTSLALMNAFAEEAGIKLTGVQVLDPVVLPGVLLGAMLPFLFAALTMLSVGRAAESIMWECRDQMNKKYLEGVPLAPAKCVEISTVSSLKEMVAPGVLAVFTPAIVGAALGAPGLLGLLTGAISSGFLLAVMMANAGGAWDNAKKYVEKGNLGEGRGKHSENHTAVIVGDTVGDPFKDTSGPALNILIKLMSVISLVLAPKLQKEPWEEGWYYSLVIMFVLAVGGYLFQKYGQGLELHNKEEILAATKRRKEGGAPAAAAAPEADVEEAREDGADAAAEEEPDLNAPVKLMQEARKADNKDGADAAEESQE